MICCCILSFKDAFIRWRLANKKRTTLAFDFLLSERVVLGTFRSFSAFVLLAHQFNQRATAL